MDGYRIHPTAVIHPKARLASDVRVGAHAVIDGEVQLGEGCEVGPHVYLTGHTVIGSGNRFHSGCVIGDAPQDFKYQGQATRLEIGDGNTFREHVTIHRSNRLEEATVIGNGNYFMIGSHVGHNCRLGNQITVAGGALLAGHVIVHHQAFISGNCLIHQFCRVGRLALMQGGSGISKDLPPFCIARGKNRISGLNTIGLRRAGISAADRLILRRCYHLLFRSGERLHEAARQVLDQFPGHPLAVEFAEFALSSRRGLCPDRSTRSSGDDSDE